MIIFIHLQLVFYEYNWSTQPQNWSRFEVLLNMTASDFCVWTLTQSQPRHSSKQQRRCCWKSHKKTTIKREKKQTGLFFFQPDSAENHRLHLLLDAIVCDLFGLKKLLVKKSLKSPKHLTVAGFTFTLMFGLKWRRARGGCWGNWPSMQTPTAGAALVERN